MNDEELEQAVRRLRARGYAPKEIARALGVRPAVVVSLVRLIEAERTAAETERELVGCWVSPGWRVGLTLSGHREWPDGETAYLEAGGLVGMLIACEDRNQQISVCGYLLGFFSGWASGAVPAPIELARELVLGVAEYARTLGFRPHADFEQARGHLREWEGPGAIRFGCEGTPTFTEGRLLDPVGRRARQQALGRRS